MIRSPPLDVMTSCAPENPQSSSFLEVDSRSKSSQLERATGTPKTNDVLLQMISFQGWLSRFSDPYVRGSFLAGRFSVSNNTDGMLRSMDRIREMMLPSPNLGREACANAALVGIDFFNKFISRESSEPLDLDGCYFPVRKTYRDWYDFLGDLSVSNFWCHRDETLGAIHSHTLSGTAGKQDEAVAIGLARSRHFTCDKPRQHKPEFIDSTEPFQESGPDGNEFRASDGQGYRGISSKKQSGNPERPFTEDDYRSDRGVYRDHDISGEFNKLSLHPAIEDKRTREQWSPFRSRPAESDGQTNNKNGVEKTHSPPCDPASDRDHCWDGPRHGGASRSFSDDRDIYELLRHIKQPREAVSPGVFSGDDGASMKEFLNDYESFFTTKYDGNEKQQSRLLGQHLDGPTKLAYDAMDGSRLRYSVLKSELLHWYKGERTSLRNRSENEFRKARMGQGDSLRIYALRLQRFASRAFADSVHECERQLCRKFWKTVPESFHRVLSNNEKSLALHGEARKLDWAEMVRLAESEDRYKRDRREDKSSDSEAEPEMGIWYSRPVTSPPLSYQQRRTTGNSIRKNAGARVSFGGTRLDSRSETTIGVSPVVAGTRTGPPNCNWCGRRGHLENTCWMKTGACLICGSGAHNKDGCPRYDSGWGGFKPSCSSCGGPHLGKDCDQSN